MTDSDLHRAAAADLGWANGWQTTPAIVKLCQLRRHRQWSRRKGCSEMFEFGCDKCGYKYSVDQSD